MQVGECLHHHNDRLARPAARVPVFAYLAAIKAKPASGAVLQMQTQHPHFS
jgi:hypothetical protein